ncbi:hypothetical protein SMA90_27080, partial [Escherichia coli]
MKSIAGVPVPGYLGINNCTAVDSTVVFFQNYNARSFTHDKSLPMHIKGDRSFLGIFCPGQGTAVVESSYGNGNDSRLGPSCDDGIGITVPDSQKSLAYSMGGCGTGRHYGQAGTLGIVGNGNISGCHIGDHSGDEQRGYAV